MTQRRVVGLLFVLVLLGSAANVALAVTKPDRGADAASRPAVTADGYRPANLAGPGGPALEVAVRTAGLVLTYDHDHLDADLRRATAAMTPGLAATFRRSFRRTVVPAARRQRIEAVGVVRAAGLVRSRGADHATCLVYLDQRVRARAGASSTPSLPARVVRVDVVRRDGDWLVAGLDPL